MTYIPLLILLCAAGRMHGIGGIPGGRIFSTMIVAAAVGMASATLFGWWFLSTGILAAVVFNLGHGNFYGMQGANDGFVGPDGTVSTPEWLERHGGRSAWNLMTVDSSIRQPLYSWWMMGLKWLLISIGIGPAAFAIALFAPAAYTVSFRRGSSALAEWLTTIFMACVVGAILLNNY